MKILTIIGARPQFIKAAAVSRQLKTNNIPEIIVHTGQHFDDNMSKVFFDEMDIPLPNYNLNVHSLSHGAMTGRMLEGIEQIIISEKPTLVMVYGDTNSTLAGALAAVKMHVPVAHVEAGLRSFNLEMPEEVNRILTDRVSSHLFCPTQASVQNLLAEGFGNFNCRIEITGDVMQDVALYYGAKSAERSKILSDLKINSPFALTTFHRQENTDDPAKLKGIVEALNEIHRKMEVVVPIHPRTEGLIKSMGIITDFRKIPPVGYFDMMELLKGCSLVLTDSGGLQKEAFFFGKCCVTMRQETEWVELVEHGFNLLAYPEKETILKAWEQMINLKPNFNIDLYGNGKASERIAKYIKSL
ncbi:MAG TPA: UDP-N-acetylglucosamine 2-epimerase (non-hydrolyzing) [Tenuifilaceae bacterium]|nr:UDP-N-acetylglucosamine 2-epimerase (non-hydrolyzing) [Tenuifilaceae bacterium]HNV80837.1 UDP-N-acetylglucosamine 2-epimerase (non-hydrolyzing) [Tenuifilaceae bacterium]